MWRCDDRRCDEGEKGWGRDGEGMGKEEDEEEEEEREEEITDNCRKQMYISIYL